MGKIKVGDRVRLLDTPEVRHYHDMNPDFHQEPGTVGVVCNVISAEDFFAEDIYSGNIIVVQWPKRYLGKIHRYVCADTEVEVVE